MDLGALLLAAWMYVGSSTPITWEALQFPDAASRARVLGLVAWAQGRTVGWRHESLRLIGNFVNERWCGAQVSEPACSGGAVVHGEPGSSWVELEVLHYSTQWPRVFGLGVSVGSVPMQGLGVTLSLMHGGQGISGDGLWIRYVHDGESLDLGSVQAWRVIDSTVSIDAPGDWRDELRLLSASVASLRATALNRVAALRERAERNLDSGKILGFDEGPYNGRGIPPIRTPRPLGLAERERERAALHAEMARRTVFIERWHKEMHAQLLAIVPIDLLVR